MRLVDVIDSSNPINKTPKPMIDSFENIITDQNNTSKILREYLGNVLATIHRDGGQYVEKYGIEKATVDAIEKWHMHQVNFDDAKNRVEELAGVIEHKDSCIATQEKHNDELKERVRELESDKARLLALLTSENRPQKTLAEYRAEVENAGIIPKTVRQSHRQRERRKVVAGDNVGT